MDIGLTCRGSDTDRLVLQHATEATHRMTFEVGKIDHKIIVFQVRTHTIVVNPCGIYDRNGEVTLLVHKIHLGNIQEAMFANGLPMFLGISATTPIGGVAFNQCATHRIHKLLNKTWLKIIVTTRLARRDLHSHPTRRRSAQGFINAHQCRRRYLLCHIDGWGHIRRHLTI